MCPVSRNYLFLLQWRLSTYRTLLTIFCFYGPDTTRNPRAGEVNGVDYNFVTRDEFLAGVARKEFIEHAEFSGNLYGTTVNAVKSVGDQGKICILDIDMQVSALQHSHRHTHTE